LHAETRNKDEDSIFIGHRGDKVEARADSRQLTDKIATAKTELSAKSFFS
jgi:hypothetical protein